MHLYDLPILFVLAGLVFYTVLGGADFGAGMWQLTAGAAEAGAEIRDHAHDSMAPVWEANHVWLIFVITVFWTAYPVAFGSIFSTLSIPLFIAALGLIFRGAAYALRSGARTHRESRRIDTLFAVSSLLTPFALGCSVGAIAGRRVPVGNATGHLFASWLGPTSILIGVLAVTASAYLAAVFLAADAVRTGRPGLADAFRIRALAAGVLAGAIAIGGVAVVHSDAHHLYAGLTHGLGLGILIVSLLAGLLALVLVATRRFNLARYAAAVAVAAIIAGWAAAQEPVILPGLTIAQAAAPYETDLLVVIAVLAGGVLLFPSLALLFRLFLGGRLGEGPEPDRSPPATADAPAPPSGTRAAAPAKPSRTTAVARGALATFAAGLGLTVFAAGWAQGLGVVCLVLCVILGVAAVGPAQIADAPAPQRPPAHDA